MSDYGDFLGMVYGPRTTAPAPARATPFSAEDAAFLLSIGIECNGIDPVDPPKTNKLAVTHAGMTSMRDWYTS